MIPGLRKASFTVETAEEQARNVDIKKRLIHELSVTVKELQKTHLDDDFEVDKNDEHALMLCTLLEAALLHGYQHTGIKMSNFYNLLGKISQAESMPNYSFWNVLVHFTHKDIRKELEHLSHITTPIGQCRAWIRLALNDCLMESYLDAMLSDISKLRTYYKPGAFMLEEEIPYIMISFLQGLMDFKFNLNYNTPSLNNWTGDALAFAGIWQLPKLASHSPQPSSVPQSQAAARSPSNSISTATVPSHRNHRPVDIVNKRSRDESNEVEIAKSVKENDNVELVVDAATVNKDQVLDVGTGTESDRTVHTGIEEEKPNISDKKNEFVESQEENKISKAERHATVSPVLMLGSNKLGVGSGWSSAFDPGALSPEVKVPEEIKTHEAAPILTKEALQAHLVSDPETYTNMLSGYTVQAQAKFDDSLYNQEDGRTKISIPKVKSPELEPQMPGFEVVPQNSSVHSEHTDDRTHFLMSVLTQITNERGLDNQNYQCNDCGRNIGMIYGEAKVCKYDSCYYCFECHVEEEHVIPARIIYNWDLRKHSVCKSTKMFLLQIEEEPLLNIDETNPSLYTVIEELKEVKMLRTQLLHLKGFLFTCKEPIAEEVRRRIWPREYLWDDIHQYSLLDLIQTNSGQLAHHLKKVISYCKKHVYKCQLCCQKGFICEFCNDSKIIYPFQIKFTTQCPKCKAVFHKACIADRKCPKCTRRQKQLAGKVMDSNTLEFNSPWE